MSALRQTVRVVVMNFLSLQSRFTASAMIVVGMAAVVAVALSIFSMAAGLLGLVERGTAPDRMVVLSQGAASQGGSAIPRDSLATIADMQGIRKGADGKPVVVGQVDSNYVTRKRDTRGRAFVTVWGVEPNYGEVRPELRLIDGRAVTPGRREIIAGTAAVARYEGVELGAKLLFQDGPWEVVGIFETGQSMDSLLLTDAETLRSALRRNAYNLIRVGLEDGSEAAQQQFVAALNENPALKVSAESEPAYTGRQLGPAVQFYSLLSFGVGGIMGLGALFAGLNTMYAAVSARRLEIATLRAIGFGALPVAISVVVESLALAALGAIAGALIAWLAFNGRGQDFGSYAVAMQVTPGMVAAGLGFAAAIGLVGAIFPAIRAARLPVAMALQVR